MYATILVAAALQRWERYSAHALAARDVAAALASGSSRQLHVLSVYEYDRIPVSRMPELSHDLAARFHEEESERTNRLMEQKLDEYVAPLAGQGLRVSKLLRVGRARDLIVEVAREIRADLVVIGTHSKRGVLDVALGGTARHVASHAPCPVIMVSPAPR